MPQEQRRNAIVDALKQADAPLSGSALGTYVGVSRQVVVQDIALLRSQGVPIMSTNRGYVLEGASRVTRLFKAYHTTEQTEDELTTIVDLGGWVLDVFVNHRAYGKVSARLDIKSRRDIALFSQDIQSGKSTPLMDITSGYHFHHVSAESESVLNEIEQALAAKGFLAEFTDYERETLV